MIGAQALVASLVEAGVDVCFMNPGTSEMHFVSALDSVPEMRGVLALFEGVATGAADGYARMTGRPAAVLLHLGPGLANGLANLHNARRARSPVVAIVGAHATGHVRHDAPLQSDIEALARTVSGWVHTCGDTRDVARDAMRAVAAASSGQVATLVLPADVSWTDGAATAPPRPAAEPEAVHDVQIATAAALLTGAAAVLAGSSVHAVPATGSSVHAVPATGSSVHAVPATGSSVHAASSAGSPGGAAALSAGSPVGAARASAGSPAGAGGSPVMLLLGGRALTERGLRAASRIAAATGARLLTETFPARMERGAGIPAVAGLAYLVELADTQLAGTEHLILAGARAPVAFFAYPGREGDLVPRGCQVSVLADAAQDVEGALGELADRVAPRTEPVLAEAATPGVPAGPLTAASLAAAVAASLPEHAIVVDEANTSGYLLPRTLASAPRHSVLTLTGGAIGYGMPVATGAAIAAPDRPVLSLEADGSALYTIQALWTQAREQLNVTTVLINNAAYAILKLELARTNAGQAGPRAARMLDLSGPTPDFAQISTGLGVPATRVDTSEDLAAALRRAYSEPGPHLIEAIMAPIV
ncbi:MAG: acetolactate synthase large subunit [Streptosporangiaceae bacterium]